MKLSPAVPMWRQVADHLRAQILDGTFPAGQVLPSEETLAREFGVSRPVIRDGIKILVSEGFVEIRRPHGNLVRDPYAAPTRTEHATYYRTCIGSPATVAQYPHADNQQRSGGYVHRRADCQALGRLPLLPGSLSYRPSRYCGCLYRARGSYGERRSSEAPPNAVMSGSDW
ncbi:MAG TPA: winged helix-turn-helix domain-containing protein [Kribbella sp.]|jgi:DNA-binding transcriptional regulator YhcF (GntR family)